MPAGRSKGWASKVYPGNGGRLALNGRDLRQQPVQLVRPDRPAAPAVTLLSVLNSLAQAALSAIGAGSPVNLFTGSPGNGVIETRRQEARRSPYRAASVAPVQPRPVAGVASFQQPAETRQPGIQEPLPGTPGMPGMAGPLHTDFVRQPNRKPQAVAALAIMLMRPHLR